MITDEDRQRYCQSADIEMLLQEYDNFSNTPEIVYELLCMSAERDRLAGIPDNEFSVETWRIGLHLALVEAGMKGYPYAYVLAKQIIRMWVPEVHEKCEMQCAHCHKWSNERNLVARYFDGEGWIYVCPKCKNKYDGMIGIRTKRE